MIYSIKNTSFRIYIYIIALFLFFNSCGIKPTGDIAVSELAPKMEPDYSEVTIPANIAPLNFIIKETGSAYYVKISSDAGPEIEVSSKAGKIDIPERSWKRMLQNNKGKEFKVDIYSSDEQNKWSKFKTFSNRIAQEPIDPYLYYRLLFPGYES